MCMVDREGSHPEASNRPVLEKSIFFRFSCFFISSRYFPLHSSCNTTHCDDLNRRPSEQERANTSYTSGYPSPWPNTQAELRQSPVSFGQLHAILGALSSVRLVLRSSRKDEVSHGFVFEYGTNAVLPQ